MPCPGGTIYDLTRTVLVRRTLVWYQYDYIGAHIYAGCDIDRMLITLVPYSSETYREQTFRMQIRIESSRGSQYILVWYSYFEVPYP